jgi:hypothetical protein
MYIFFPEVGPQLRPFILTQTFLEQVFKSHKKQSSFSALSVSVGSEGIKADLLKAQEEEVTILIPPS